MRPARRSLGSDRPPERNSPAGGVRFGEALVTPAEAETLTEIGTRARTLDECLADAAASGAARANAVAVASLDNPRVTERLAAWSRALAPNFPDALRHRLEWDGLDALQLPIALDSPRPGGATASALPGWLGFLAEVSRAASLPADDDDQAAIAAADPSDALPFIEVLLPFLRAARPRLESGRKHETPHFNAQARAQCEAHLLRRLSLRASQVLFERFAEFRAGFKAKASDTQSCYRAFVQILLGENGLLRFFREYSVLARLLVRVSQQWIENWSRLLDRLRADHAAIAELLQLNPDDLGEIISVTPGLSDPHAGGQQVAILEFSSGQRLVYKPKDLGHERAYHALLRWLAAHGLADAPPALRILDRPGYGWAEWAAASPCENAEELARYHRRAGVLLSLVYALGGDDCHRENLLATRHGPVLLDAESLLRPPLETWANGPPQNGTQRLAERTVLHTGLLPLRRPTPPPEGSSAPPDISGLRGRGGESSGSRKLTWTDVNTDAMQLVWTTVVGAPGNNLPTLADGDAPVSSETSLPELVAGFETGYRFLLAHRAALSAPDGPLASFAAASSRLIFRPTRIYARLLQNLAAPAFQREGIERSLALEALARAFVTAPEKPFFWPLLAPERAALEALDVPLFTADAVAAALGVETREFFADPTALLTSLSEADLFYQRDLLQTAFFDAADHESQLPQAPQADCAKEGTAGTLTRLAPQISDAELTQEAARLGRELTARADENFCPTVSPARLYDGDLGVALFLAALEKIQPAGEHLGRIRAICRRVIQAVNADTDDASPQAAALGAYTGWGGTVYGLLAIGRLLGDSAYVEFARRAARQITPERIAADRNHDVFAGAAGAVLALLALHRTTGDAASLATAVQCGQHLVESSRPGPRAGRAWPAPTPAAPMLAGFAHGAAGIACALQRLFALRSEPAFFETARAAVLYERSVFLPAHRNWPYVRSSDPAADPKPVLFNTWCHGAPGIALGRLAALAILDAPSIRREIDLALATTADVALPLPALDHLCCGTFGRVEILDFAARRLGRPVLHARARAWTALAVHRAASTGGYGLDPVTGKNGGGVSPKSGLFRGLAGIGYTLLRLANAGVLPPLVMPY